jgi:hypothetical protein
MLAGFDPAKYSAVCRWPMTEALVSLERLLVDEAADSYRFQVLQWAILAQSGATKEKKPPRPPELLRRAL